MNAMIFAAGLGSRLRPLTDNKPKALVEIQGKTMLELALRKMERSGITKVVVNIHHHREQMLRFLNNFHSENMEILISDEKKHLLDTGGGLLKARPLFNANEPVLLYNVDIITNAKLSDFINDHQKEKPLVSLMVKKRPTSRHLLFDNDMQLVGWQNNQTGEKIICRPSQAFNPFGFQGIHIVSPQIFDLIHQKGAFPIMSTYLHLAKNHIFRGIESKNDIWFDIGTPEKFRETEQYIAAHPEEFDE